MGNDGLGSWLPRLSVRFGQFQCLSGNAPVSPTTRAGECRGISSCDHPAPATFTNQGGKAGLSTMTSAISFWRAGCINLPFLPMNPPWERVCPQPQRAAGEAFENFCVSPRWQVLRLGTAALRLFPIAPSPCPLPPVGEGGRRPGEGFSSMREVSTRVERVGRGPRRGLPSPPSTTGLHLAHGFSLSCIGWRRG